MITTQLVDWIVDFLHVDLNLGKLTWKWALVRKLPTLVRADISSYLGSVGLGLDLRTKEEGRQSQDKFYDGGVWHTFCIGGKKNPPGPKIIADLMHIIAAHYDSVEQEHNAVRVAAAATASSAPTTKPQPSKPTSSKPQKWTSKPTKNGSKPQRGISRGGVLQPCVAHCSRSICLSPTSPHFMCCFAGHVNYSEDPPSTAANDDSAPVGAATQPEADDVPWKACA